MAMSDSHAEDISRHVRIYVTVFVSLMALTIITVSVAYLHLPLHLAIALALVIATIKGSLVACYFMHLISEKKLIFTVLILTVIFFLGLLLLPVFTKMDAVGLSSG
jgi:cytochrome c oxidase subunit 4